MGRGFLTSLLSSKGNESTFLRLALPRHTPKVHPAYAEMGDEERQNIHLSWNSDL